MMSTFCINTYYMAFPTKLSQLCTPAYVYFVVSLFAIALSAIQNIGNHNKYTVGMYSCWVPSCLAVFGFKAIYVLFWTWILNLMCKDGHRNIAWLLVLLPFILFFVVIGMLMIFQQKHKKQQKSKCMNGTCK